jgi:hypothetical protein
MEALPLYRWRAIVNLMTATLAHIQQRYTLLAICNECANTVELDVDGLVGTLGPDHPVPAIKNRLRCTRCGSDSCAVQLALPEWLGQTG